MTSSRSIPKQIRTAAFLLTGVIPLSLLAGPVAAEAVAAQQVDRLLEDLTENAEIPRELALQCHLIPLVSDAVTLRATADTTIPSLGPPGVTPVAEPTRVQFSTEIVRLIVETVPVRSLRTLSQEQPQGP